MMSSLKKKQVKLKSCDEGGVKKKKTSQKWLTVAIRLSWTTFMDDFCG